MHEVTYSLGFFLGPGLPLGFAVPSAGMGVDRFTPITDAGCLIAVPPGDVASCVGSGVELASELFSCDATVVSLGNSSTVGAGDEAIDGDSV